MDTFISCRENFPNLILTFPKWFAKKCIADFRENHKPYLCSEKKNEVLPYNEQEILKVLDYLSNSQKY